MQTAARFLKTSREHCLCDTYRSGDIEASANPADKPVQVAANKDQQRFCSSGKTKASGTEILYDNLSGNNS
jgi:hypothetical protein